MVHLWSFLSFLELDIHTNGEIMLYSKIWVMIHLKKIHFCVSLNKKTAAYNRQGFSCIEIFLAASRTNFRPAKAVFDWFMWFMSDVNDCCTCGSAHVNWGRKSRDPSPRSFSLGPFTPGHFMRLLWSDSYLIVKRPVLWIRNGFKSDRSNHLCLGRIPDETGQV